MDAQQYNEKLDTHLRNTGRVDKEIWLEFMNAYTYDAASTVGWVEAKLRLLKNRVLTGQSLYLFEKDVGSEVCVSTVSQFENWVEATFPGAKVN